MTYDLDTPIPLRNTHSSKWDAAERAIGVTRDDAIPMWVADMDFAPAPAVTAALQAEIDRNVFGYFGPDDSVRAAICNWMNTQHGWAIEPDWIHFSTGVVHGYKMLIEAFSEPDDGVILFTPVYHAFARVLKAKNRRILECELAQVDGRYEMDFDALDAMIDDKTRIITLCSPHNPGGRMWSAAELKRLAEFARDRDLLLISDEIHMDLTFPGHAHIPTAVAAPDCLSHLVCITAASKGFNLAGGETGFMITPDPALRKKIAPSIASHGCSPNRFGMVMTEAAFSGGHDWSADVRSYLAENFTFFRDRVSAIPGLSIMDMTSTYLTWVNFAGTGMQADEASRRIIHEAGLAPSPGPQFGKGGGSWKRFNIAMPRSLLIEATERLEDAFSDLQ